MDKLVLPCGMQVPSRMLMGGERVMTPVMAPWFPVVDLWDANREAGPAHFPSRSRVIG